MKATNNDVCISRRTQNELPSLARSSFLSLPEKKKSLQLLPKTSQKPSDGWSLQHILTKPKALRSFQNYPIHLPRETIFAISMELSSSLLHLSKISPSDLSFSISLSPFPFQIQLKRSNSKPPISPISAVSVPPQETAQNSPQRLLKELAERKKTAFPKKKIPPRRFILKPPLDDAKLTQRFLDSPQLSLKAFPLLSSCLPPARLNNADKTWIDEYLLEAKQALGYPLEPSDRFGDDNPAKQFDTLLYLAFQYPSCERTRTRHVRVGHSRLWFLGQYVLELAFAEYFLQRYPRESPAPIRERVYGLIGKRFLPKWIKAASLQNLVFPYDEIDKLKRREREPPVK